MPSAALSVVVRILSVTHGRMGREGLDRLGAQWDGSSDTAQGGRVWVEGRGLWERRLRGVPVLASAVDEIASHAYPATGSGRRRHDIKASSAP